jgi:hypothetical protein
MAKFVKGMHGVMREHIEDYATSEYDPRFTIIPSAVDGHYNGRNVKMTNIERPDIEIRDIAVDENGGETIVATWNPSKPKSRKVMKMVSEHEEFDEIVSAPIKNVLESDEDIPPQSNEKSATWHERAVTMSKPQEVTKLPTFKIVGEAPKISAHTPISTEAPRQLVKFHTSEAVIGFRYHEVILKDISLVLVFDKDYQAAIPPEFTATEGEKTFRIEVEGFPYLLHCMYYGQTFEHNNFIYTLFVVFETQELK